MAVLISLHHMLGQIVIGGGDQPGFHAVADFHHRSWLLGSLIGANLKRVMLADLKGFAHIGRQRDNLLVALPFNLKRMGQKEPAARP